MTETEFIEALAELRWKQSTFCERAGVSRNAASRWATGAVRIPPWVGPFLGAMLEIKRLHDSYVAVD